MDHALEVICGKVSDDMDVVQEVEILPGVGMLVAQYFSHHRCMAPRKLQAEHGQ